MLSTISNAQKKSTLTDSTAYYNDLFNELDDFLDSITAPRTFWIGNVNISNSYLNFTDRSNVDVMANRKLNLTPSLGYYHKSGLGLNASALVVHDGEKLNAFQFAAGGSYDYLRNTAFLTGVSFTHFFTKDSLPFYTSPLENEGAFYFTYKRSWIKPSITASYGWGSRTAYEEREEKIKILRKKNNAGYTIIETEEKVNDFTIAASLRHDFFWMDKIGPKTTLRFTPQFTFTSGTQRFGFNQTSNSYVLPRKTGTNLLYNTENVQLDSKDKFKPLSITAFFKSEASWNNFYIQPQIGFDYYLPAKENNFTTAIAINVGASF
jgi:hypothetical protein